MDLICHFDNYFPSSNVAFSFIYLLYIVSWNILCSLRAMVSEIISDCYPERPHAFSLDSVITRPQKFMPIAKTRKRKQYSTLTRRLFASKMVEGIRTTVSPFSLILLLHILFTVHMWAHILYYYKVVRNGENWLSPGISFSGKEKMCVN